MRKIKFRLWDVEEKCFMNHSRVIESRVLALENNGEGRFIFQQWTGLLDRQGRKIYEGDITIDGYGTVTVIENDGFQWLERIVRLRDRHISKEILIMTKANAFRCEVIGNIYENPELLEGE